MRAIRGVLYLFIIYYLLFLTKTKSGILTIYVFIIYRQLYKLFMGGSPRWVPSNPGAEESHFPQLPGNIDGRKRWGGTREPCDGYQKLFPTLAAPSGTWAWPPTCLQITEGVY